MNKNQKIVIGIGVSLIALLGLFPPYEGIQEYEIVFKRPIGHHFILLPPSSENVCKTLCGKDTQLSNFRANFYSRILFAEVLFQFLVIILVIFGIVILLAKDRGV